MLLTSDDLEDAFRQIKADAVETAVSTVLTQGDQRAAANRAGAPPSSPTTGYYDDDGKWNEFYRCGDPLDSAGLA